jgi:hypothetical protein
MEAEMMDEHVAGPARESFLLFLLNALGWRYSLGLPLFAVIALVLTLILVARGRGPNVGAALVFIVPLPLLLGLFGALDGLLMSYAVLASSAVAPKPSEVAAGYSAALVTVMVGFVAMGPAFLVATAGLFIRSFMGETTGPRKE